MKTYPSIPYIQPNNQSCYGFLKYDGSNIRCEWSSKKGWYKFGSRKQLLSEDDPVLGPAIPLFKKKYGDVLPPIFKHNKWNRVIVFCEFFGPNSFAGMHDPNDDKNIVLFDVNPIPKGMLGPQEFCQFFGEHGPPLMYTGLFTDDLIIKVKNEPMFGEGLVVKGGMGHKLWMTKIKTDVWKNKLKEHYKEEWEKYY